MKREVILVTLAFVFAALALQGQGTNAALSGTVSDPMQALIPGASITAENRLTGITSSTVSNEAGVYNFPSLQPGAYRVSSELPGFKKHVFNDVILEVGARVVLNFQLEVAGAAGTTVEVTAQMDSALALGTSTVGTVIEGRKVTDLPLPARDALGLVFTQAGVLGGNFSGSRIGALNITRDGVNVMDQHINQGLNPDTATINAAPTVVFNSVDIVQEVRVVTSPADAEFGRGSGQVQILTRSGTNEFRGSLFESHRNTALNANTWFNNQRGDPRNVLLRHQFGGRLGGPIARNRSFFHFLYDAQRQVTKNTVTNTVYTESARRGIFRYYPGARNANFIAGEGLRTVDVNGNPERPRAATGELVPLDVFGRDPNRLRADPTGVVGRLMALAPLPNNFRSGDGLNSAGYTWSRRATNDRDQINVRIDHTFSSRHNASFSYTHETEDNLNGNNAQPFPEASGGKFGTVDNFYTLSFTSTLTPKMLNEFRVGAQRARIRAFGPWDTEGGMEQLPTAGGLPYALDFTTITDPIVVPNAIGCCGYGYIAPLYNYSDNLTWTNGRHTFKGGAEVRFVSSAPFSAFAVMPRAIIGAGGAPVTGVTGAVIPSLGTNEGDAQTLLLNLSGSVSGIDQAFNSSPPPGVEYRSQNKIRHWQQREFSFFFKDDFKLRPGFTLNLGFRYEFYGVPYERRGQTAGILGGSAGMFGLSGTGFADMYRPYHQAGSETKVQLVGKNSPNPDTLIYNNDLNNFAPAVGLSWSIPWLGKDKTVLRAGYSVGYERDSLRMFNIVVGDQPGLRTVVALRPSTAFDLTRVSLPLTTQEKPLGLNNLLTDRTQTIRGFDTNLRTPYVQNWNMSIQRQLPGNFSLDVRYVANKGTKLIRGTNLNEVNIFETGILDGFKAIQTGGESELMDRMLSGYNLGLGAVNGTTNRAGRSLRTNSSTRAFFANNNVGDFANFLNSTTLFSGVAGGLLRNARLPENFIVANPQFASANLTGNFSNSTYHSMQVDVTRRFSGGWMFQSNFTWSKALGDEEGSGQEMLDSFRNGRDRSQDKRILSFDRKFVFRNSGAVELPFGPGKRFLNASSGVLARLLERWQVSPIVNLFSGTPFSFTSTAATFNQLGDNFPMLVGPMPTKGKITRLPDGITYFPDLKPQPDPGIANLTASDALNTRSTLYGITDSSGRFVLVNPEAGVLGNLAPLFATGPVSVRFDVNLMKRVRVSEKKELEFRIDAIDVLNTPQFGAADGSISSTTFGRVTTATGNRIVVLGARFSF